MNSLRRYKKFCLNYYFTIIINYCLAVLTLCMICYFDSLTQQFPWISIQTTNPYLDQEFLNKEYMCNFKFTEKYFIQLSVFESTILNYKNIRQVIDTPIKAYYRTTKRTYGMSMNILLCDKTSVIINAKSSNHEKFLVLMKVVRLLKSKINNQ